MAKRSRFRRWSFAAAKAVWPRSWPKRIALVVGTPIVAFLLALNLSIAWFGDTVVFPLSPFSVSAKLGALGQYFVHRPICAITGHRPLDEIIAETAKKRGVDRWLLASVVQVESGTQAHRISPSGAMGAAQLIPSTAVMLGVRDPFDPEQGIDGGARYLKELLGRFDGDARLAVAAYNAGPGAVRNGRVPHNGETEFYVARVLAQWAAIRPKVPMKAKWSQLRRPVVKQVVAPPPRQVVPPRPKQVVPPPPKQARVRSKAAPIK